MIDIAYQPSGRISCGLLTIAFENLELAHSTNINDTTTTTSEVTQESATLRFLSISFVALLAHVAL